MVESEGDGWKGRGVRLDERELTAIRSAARLAFGPTAVVRLFGSRADDTRKGGDIDLHVEIGDDLDAWQARTRFEDCVFARIEEQRIDLVLHRRGDPMRGIDLIAHRDGVPL